MFTVDVAINGVCYCGVVVTFVPATVPNICL